MKDAWYKTTQKKHPYYFAGTCVDFKDGNEVMNLVRQDNLSYPASTFYHDPSLQIATDDFERMTGLTPSVNGFCGYNADQDVVFWYDAEEDIHHFYRKT